MNGVGIALWLAGGAAAFLIARIVPWARRGWWLELAVTLTVALLLGVLATALDFGGWKELEWRAGLFAFFGSFAAAGSIRVLQSLGKSQGGRS
jgi:hypothetical protein